MKRLYRWSSNKNRINTKESDILNLLCGLMSEAADRHDYDAMSKLEDLSTLVLKDGRTQLRAHMYGYFVREMMEEDAMKEGEINE